MANADFIACLAAPAPTRLFRLKNTENGTLRTLPPPLPTHPPPCLYEINDSYSIYVEKFESGKKNAPNCLTPGQSRKGLLLF
jgi:hypothetical protein